MNIKQVPTTDFTKGRKSFDFIVMHWSVTSNISQVDSEVLNPNRQMSYHYCIDNGEIHQYVDEVNTAWHSGVFDINQRSIGICIVAGPNNPYTDQDYATASQLIAEILQRHPNMQVKGHRDFKATECPGNLDFNRLKRKDDPMIGKLYNEPDGRVFISFDNKKFYVENPDSIAGLPIENGVAPGVLIPHIVEKQVEKIVTIDNPVILKQLKETQDALKLQEDVNAHLEKSIDTKNLMIDNLKATACSPLPQEDTQVLSLYHKIINWIRGVK